MRELTNKSASIACELAALLMVVEECDVDQVERENLISGQTSIGSTCGKHGGAE